MTTGPKPSDVDWIDEVTWHQLVKTLLECDAEIISRRCDQISIGAGAGTRIYRVTGRARTRERKFVDWTLVLKFLSTDAADFQAISTDQNAWDYWKREWHAYQAPWQQQLPGPFVAARCIGTGGLGHHQSSKELAWIAMEDLAAYEHRPWPQPYFRQVARHLGLFNGDYLSGQPLPDEPWLSHGWVRGWTDQAEPLIGLLPTVSDHSVISQIFPRDVISDLTKLWEQRKTLYNTLDQLPRVLCHNDVFPRNLFIRRESRRQSVAIDWAFCGPGPVGQELSALIGASNAFLESRPDVWDELERDCFDGYIDGLRDAGSRVATEEVLLGYLLSTVLRFGLGALQPVLGLTLHEENRAVAERIFGYPFLTIVRNLAAARRFQQHRIRRAIAILGL